MRPPRVDGSCSRAAAAPASRRETASSYLGREAVVSTIHVKHLVEMAPAEAWGEDFVYGVETYDIGLPGMAAYFATTEPPVFHTANGPRSAVSAGTVGWAEDVIQLRRATSRTASPWRACPGCSWPRRRSPTRRERPRAITR